MKKIISILVVTGFAFITGAAAADQPVKAVWDKHCASCHGKDGKGDTKMGKKSGVKDYTDPKVQAEMNDEKALRALKEGLVENGKEKMKSYSDKITEAEMKAVIAYMRTFVKK
jgi:mono/diheme cytochrome c family protein